MKSENRFCYKIDDSLPALSESAERFGGKAGATVRLWRIPGVRIPESWVLPPDLFLRFMEYNFSQDEILDITRRILAGESAGFDVERMENCRFPDEIVDEIFKMLPPEGVLIVRSSGIFEDSSDHSMAGHYKSIPARAGNRDVLSAIRKCWFSGLQVFARLIYNPDEEKSIQELSESLFTSLGILIQRMIPAEKSGIYFSQSPLHADKGIIVANYGTCHSCVDGKMACDLYLLSGGEFLGADNRYKFEMTLPEKPDGEYLPGERIDTPLGRAIAHFPYAQGIISVAVPSPHNRSLVLNRDEIRQIYQTGESIRESMGFHIDMEWSFHEGKLHVLQTRPLTTCPPQSDFIPETSEGYLIASPGIARGPIRMVLSVDDIDRVEEGDILTVNGTDPEFMPAIYKCAGIISEEGSPLSHTAIVARELKIPCIIGVKGAAGGLLKEGQVVTLNADRGRILPEDVSVEDSADRFIRNQLVYDVDHLSLIGNNVIISVSALLYGFFILKDSSEPNIAEIESYISELKKRYGLENLGVHWDIADDGNSPLEDPCRLRDLKMALAGRTF